MSNRVKIFGAILITALFLVSMSSSVKAELDPAQPHCFQEVRKLDGAVYSDKEKIVETTPVCSKDLEGAGFVMTGLPADFPAPGHCYFWPLDASVSGQEIPCTDPRIAGAGNYGSQGVPPPPSLPASSATNTAVSNPERDKNINCPQGTPPDKCSEVLVANNSLVALVRRTIQFFTVVVGVVITAVIVWAGIEYSSAGGDPNKTTAAKHRIRNAIIALVVYIFLGTLLNFLVPGGIFS